MFVGWQARRMGDIMIIQFLLSVLAVLGVDALGAWTSGVGFLNLFDAVQIPCIVLILAAMIFLSGYGKDFCVIFFLPSKTKDLPLSKLRRAEKGMDFAIRTLFCVCTFFMLVGIIFFYLNIDYRQSLGPNLAVALLSVYYLCFFILILLPVKAELRRRIVSAMTEEPLVQKKRKASVKECLAVIFKLILAVAVIAVAAYAVIAGSTVNMQEVFRFSLIYMLDAPSFLMILVPGLLFLCISGNVRIFGRAVSSVFRNAKITVTEKNLFENVFSLLSAVVFCSGIKATLIGLVGILNNLEDASALGANMYIATLPSAYAVILCLVLLVLQGRLSALCDE